MPSMEQVGLPVHAVWMVHRGRADHHNQRGNIQPI